MFLKSEVIILSVLVVACLAQEKWVWNGKTAKAVRDGDRVRYGIVEPEDDYRPRPSFRPPPPDLPPLIRPPTHNLPPPPLPPTRHDSDPTSFEKCKCVHSFNCKSPGLLFGSCDKGKKYCCEKSVEPSETKGFHPDQREPEVLAGPGGPVDHIRNQNAGHQGLGSYGQPYDRPGNGALGGYGQPRGTRF
ncbi:unnamed protein product [Nezara viridula]|uniref:Neuropeptide n=1 Tax=Nezara viridula TaxID=85310 RepID=A0A9P0HJN0_NEZVI|nr:unnamed protein product [Nezara viridula]